MDHILTFRLEVSHASQQHKYKLCYYFPTSTCKSLKQFSFQVLIFEDPIALEQYIICKLLGYYLWEIEEKNSGNFWRFFFFLGKVVKVMNFRRWRAEGRESLFFFLCFLSESFFSRSNLRTLSWSFNKTKWSSGVTIYLHIEATRLLLCFVVTNFTGHKAA